MLNEYTQKFINKLKDCKTDEERSNIIDKIYAERFEDGAKEGYNDGTQEE